MSFKGLVAHPLPTPLSQLLELGSSTELAMPIQKKPAACSKLVLKKPVMRKPAAAARSVAELQLPQEFSPVQVVPSPDSACSQALDGEDFVVPDFASSGGGWLMCWLFGGRRLKFICKLDLPDFPEPRPSPEHLPSYYIRLDHELYDDDGFKIRDETEVLAARWGGWVSPVEFADMRNQS